MIRAALLTFGLLGLAACATDAVDANPSSYTLGRGTVNYDELRRAQDECKARGGTVVFKQEGGDQYQMSNYTCVIPPKGKTQ